MKENLPAKHLVPQFLLNSPHLRARWGFKLASGPLRLAVAALRRKLAADYRADQTPKATERLNQLEAFLGVWGNSAPNATGRMQRFDPRNLPDDLAQEDLVIPRSYLALTEVFDLPIAQYKNLRNKKILATISGGVGDLLMYAQLFQRLRDVHGATVDLVHQGAAYSSELLGQLFAPAIVHRYPMLASIAKSYDYTLPIGLHGLIYGESIPEFFARAYGVTLQPKGFPLSAETQRFLHRRIKLRHGIDYEAQPPIVVHAACRREKNYPHFDAVANALADRGHTVLVVGALHESCVRDRPGKLANLCGLDLWPSIALMRVAKLFVGPDSSFMHAAGAWNIPSVALFGPTGGIWATPYPKTTVVSHPMSCRFAPCWIVTRHDRPCGERLDPPCLREIPVRDIVALAERKLTDSLARFETIAHFPRHIVLYDRRFEDGPVP